jgi:hypothetical protein
MKLPISSAGPKDSRSKSLMQRPDEPNSENLAPESCVDMKTVSLLLLTNDGNIDFHSCAERPLLPLGRPVKESLFAQFNPEALV